MTTFRTGTLTFARWLRYRVEWLGVKISMGLIRLFGMERASAIAGWLTRKVGPRLGVSDVARGNLRAAFPGMPDAEIEEIVRGVWENLGRTFAEYPNLEEIWHDPERRGTPSKRIQYAGEQHLLAIRDNGTPALFFSAHLANWEIPAIGAAGLGIKSSVLFRPPNNPFVADLLFAHRSARMGRLIPTRYGAAAEALATLEAGGTVGMLVDTHVMAGVPAPFFGRAARTSTALAKLARRTRAPIHGVRVERLGGVQFKVTITPPLAVTYTDDEEADLLAIVTAINATIEGWVRERPADWNWLHNRWRE